MNNRDKINKKINDADTAKYRLLSNLDYGPVFITLFSFLFQLLKFFIVKNHKAKRKEYLKAV